MKHFNIIILLCIFVCHSVFANTKTNPDISVNILLLGRKSFKDRKQEKDHKEHHEGDKEIATPWSVTKLPKAYQKSEQFNHTEHNSDHAHGSDDGFLIQEVEVYFKSNIDPYWTGNVSLGIAQHEGNFEMDLEEVYVDSLFIPNLTIRAGKFYAFLGRHNNLHTHYYPFIDPPLVNQNLFGFHGWNSTGLSLAYLSPLPWYSEIIAQGFYTYQEKKPAAGILFFKNLWDLNDTSTLELDLSYGDGIKTFKNLYNVSLVWKWKPLESAKQYSLSWTAELLQVINDTSSENKTGGVGSYIQWQFLKNWWLEGRAEYLSHNKWSDIETQKYSFLISFAATEYSAVRVQYDTTKSDHEKWEHSVAVQGNMSLGAHPAHLY